MTKALFPISLSNQRFSTSLVVPAIEELIDKHDEVLFLVADRLQVYNRAVTLSDQPHLAKTITTSRLETFRRATRLTGTFEERRRWVDKVKLRLGERAIGMVWKIESVDTIADAKAFEILRNLDILLSVDAEFRSDVHSAASEFATRHPERLRSTAIMLSIRYIVEELALSVRLRVQRKYYDEYYIGTTLLPAVKLYAGSYLATPWDIAGQEPGTADFRFFEFSGSLTDSKKWVQVGLDDSTASPSVLGGP